MMVQQIYKGCSKGQLDPGGKREPTNSEELNWGRENGDGKEGKDLHKNSKLESSGFSEQAHKDMKERDESRTTLKLISSMGDW